MIASIRVVRREHTSEVVVGRGGGHTGDGLPTLGSQIGQDHCCGLAQCVILRLLFEGDIAANRTCYTIGLRVALSLLLISEGHPHMVVGVVADCCGIGSGVTTSAAQPIRRTGGVGASERSATIDPFSGYPERILRRDGSTKRIFIGCRSRWRGACLVFGSGRINPAGAVGYAEADALE